MKPRPVICGNRRPACALLMVVVSIVLVTAVVVMVSRRSLALAIESVDAREALQKRWGALSLQRAALTASARLYGGGEEVLAPVATPFSPEPAVALESHCEISVVLNGRTYRVILADESSKANLNVLMRLGERGSVMAAVAAMTDGKIRTLKLPAESSSGSGSGSTMNTGIEPVTAWGQVLLIGTNRQDGYSVRDISTVSRMLTLWGDGRVNLARASDEVLFELSRMIISDEQSRRWIEDYHESQGTKTLEMVLRERRISGEARLQLLNLFGTHTTCVSAWVLGDQEGDSDLLSVATGGQGRPWDVRSVQYDW